MPETSNPCEWTLEHIEPYLDGELDAGERAGLEGHCVVCAGCARELSFAIRLRRELRSLPVFPAPHYVVAAAEHAAATASSNVVALPVSRTRRRLALPLVAAAAAALVAAGWFGIKERSRSTGYSEAEIRRASEELALAFKYVDKYSDGVVCDDVIEKRVAPSIQRALRAAGSDVTSPPPNRSRS